MKEYSYYQKLSNQMHLLLHSILAVTHLLLHFILTQNTGNEIGPFAPEGIIKLAELLKSNTSLTLLDLDGKNLKGRFVHTQNRQ
jgi:hypothetical protein